MRICLGAAISCIAAAGFAAANAPDGPELASPSRHYTVKLSSLFVPPSQAMGLLIKARIDDGPVLRFLLDSGAQDIVLNQRTAALLGRSSGSNLELVGLGASDHTARRVAPATVRIGDLVLRRCGMLAVDRKLLDGIDGVIPMALFAGFLVRLDVAAKTLDLDPYPSDPASSGERLTAARTDNHLLFLQATINESQAGYVLLDTGATYSAISPAAARCWKNYRIVSPLISLRVSAGDTDGFLLPPGVRFRFGSHVVCADPAVVVDLQDLARHHGFEVAGVIGYPALRRSVLTIDYRDSTVAWEGR